MVSLGGIVRFLLIHGTIQEECRKQSLVVQRPS